MAEGDVGEVAGATGEGEVFAEGEEGVAFPHEDAAEIGVVTENDSEHVESFALVPVGGWPNGDYGGNGKVVFGDADFQAEMGAGGELIEFVNDFEAGFIAEVIDGADIEEDIKAELIVAELADGLDLGAVDEEGGFAPELDFFEDSKLCLDGADGGGEGSDHEWKDLRRRALADEGGEEFLFLFAESGFGFDFPLEAHEAFEEGFGSWGASADIDVDGENLIDSLEDGVAAIHAATGSARAHGDAPFGFGHLIPDAFDDEGHFVGDGAGDDHDVALAWGEAHDFGAEAGDIEAGSACGHEFDAATGEAHGHGPEGIFAHPIHRGVDPSDDDISLDFRVVCDGAGGDHRREFRGGWDCGQGEILEEMRVEVASGFGLLGWSFSLGMRVQWVQGKVRVGSMNPLAVERGVGGLGGAPASIEHAERADEEEGDGAGFGDDGSGEVGGFAVGAGEGTGGEATGEGDRGAGADGEGGEGLADGTELEICGGAEADGDGGGAVAEGAVDIGRTEVGGEVGDAGEGASGTEAGGAGADFGEVEAAGDRAVEVERANAAEGGVGIEGDGAADRAGASDGAGDEGSIATET